MRARSSSRRAPIVYLQVRRPMTPLEGGFHANLPAFEIRGTGKKCAKKGEEDVEERVHGRVRGRRRESVSRVRTIPNEVGPTD